MGLKKNGFKRKSTGAHWCFSREAKKKGVTFILINFVV
jgi:hypothetical protein